MINSFTLESYFIILGIASIRYCKPFWSLSLPTKSNILFSTENETKDHYKLLDKIKYNTKNITIKSMNAGVRMCVVDENNIVIFPISEEDVHPDFDLSIWIRNRQTTKFLKQLLMSV